MDSKSFQITSIVIAYYVEYFGITLSTL